MYTRCPFCHAALGANEVVEHFPVGRRLAFDAAKGRLWAVCPACERWNLTPLDERWEAIEECERRFRDTRLRVATDNVGMAKLREGLELVRIGRPERPEFAAWRYGDQLGRRRRRRILIAGAGIAASGALLAGSAVLATTIGAGLIGSGMVDVVRAAVTGDPDEIVAHFPRENDDLVPVSRREVGAATIRPDAGGESWRLHIPWEGAYERGVLHLTGEQAIHALGVLVPTLNRFGGSRSAVTNAVRLLELAGSPAGFVRETVELGMRRGTADPLGYRLRAFGRRDLLALEMALHEDAERRAMEGELAALEARWEEAEEIAGIADDLLLPAGVAGQLARLKRRVTSVEAR